MYLHVLAPAAALPKLPPTVLADKRPVPSVGPHVVPQALGCTQLLATLWTRQAGIQTDGLILRFNIWFMTHMAPLTPGGLETFPTVSTTEVPPSDNYGHVVPPGAMVLQILQVLEATCTRRAWMKPAGRSRGVGLTHVDAEVDFRFEIVAADRAGVFEVEA